MQVKQAEFLTDKEHYQILSVSVSGCIFGGGNGGADSRSSSRIYSGGFFKLSYIKL